MRSLIACAVAWLLAMSSTPADACSVAGPQLYTLAPVDGDREPPGAVSVVSTVKEPPKRQTAGCSLPGGCGDNGWITLTVTAQDDRALPAALGYKVKVVGDPGGVALAMPDQPIVARDGQINVLFRGDDAFDVTFEISAVDPNGNVGPPTTHVVHVPASFPWKLAFAIGIPVVLVLAVVGWRRRRRR